MGHGRITEVAVDGKSHIGAEIFIPIDGPDAVVEPLRSVTVELCKRYQYSMGCSEPQIRPVAGTQIPPKADSTLLNYDVFEADFFYLPCQNLFDTFGGSGEQAFYIHTTNQPFSAD
jgi:hypothetical protein